MIRYECDRCGDDDNLYCRQLKVSMVNGNWDGKDLTIHLCGYCWSKVKQLIENDRRDDA